MLGHVGRAQQPMIATAIRQIFNTDTGEEARERLAEVVERLGTPAPKVARLLEEAEEDLLAFYDYPGEHWPKLRSTNPLERVNKEIGRRSDVVGIFPNDPSAIRLVGALLIEQNDCHEGGAVRVVVSSSRRRLGAVWFTASGREEDFMEYLGIDWGTRRANWCAFDSHGELREGAVSADHGGLSRLVLDLGVGERIGCIEMMSGAVWVRDQLALVGWDIRLADARKVKAIAPLACKTDRVDARVLADLARRDLIPEVWVPSVEERANRERLRRRSHLVRLRTSAINRTFGLLTQWGLRRNLTALRKPGAIDDLAAHGVPAVWQQSIVTLLGVIEDLDAQLAPLERELRPHARADPRVQRLMTIPGVAELLGLTLASEIGDVTRFPSASKLVGYSGLTPTIKQSGQSSRTGRISKAGPNTLRWAAVEAAQQAWRPNNPWHRLYTDTKHRHGKANPAKAAIARKILIAAWHVLARDVDLPRFGGQGVVRRLGPLSVTCS
jgi:transposase